MSADKHLIPVNWQNLYGNRTHENRAHYGIELTPKIWVRQRDSFLSNS